jgi:hypothetical protein
VNTDAPQLSLWRGTDGDDLATGERFKALFSSGGVQVASTVLRA